jgi:AraC-like DNA-binding protein
MQLVHPTQIIAYIIKELLFVSQNSNDSLIRVYRLSQGNNMSINFRYIPVHQALKNHIEKIWVLESVGKIPREDMKIIVPNGRIKLIIPFRNGFYRIINGKYSNSREQQINFVGVSDISSIIDFELDEPSGTIGIEFGLSSAYRFFPFLQNELRNKMYSIEEVQGVSGKNIQEKISDAITVEQKVELIQQFLIRLFPKSVNDPIFDYCISKIKSSYGRITINQLEKETGYSRRRLHMKFQEKIGVSPKTLSSITRFTYVYQILANHPNEIFLNKIFYNLYYDQAHFIKEFRRFTGLPPTAFEKNINDFGKIFYKK